MCRVANAQWRCRHSQPLFPPHPFALHFTYICQRLGQRPSPDPDVLIHRYDSISASAESVGLTGSLSACASISLIVIWRLPRLLALNFPLPFLLPQVACQRQLTGAKLLPVSHAFSLIVLWIAYTVREPLTAYVFGRQISCFADLFKALGERWRVKGIQTGVAAASVNYECAQLENLLNICFKLIKFPPTNWTCGKLEGNSACLRVFVRMCVVTNCISCFDKHNNVDCENSPHAHTHSYTHTYKHSLLLGKQNTWGAVRALPRLSPFGF